MAKAFSWVAITITFEFEFSAGVWTDATEDVLIEPAPTWSWGIKGTGPMDLVGGPGTFTFAMRNDAGNSGGVEGYYSPGHSNARSGWQQGIAVRVKHVYSGTTRYARYYVRSIRPLAGAANRRDVQCVAADWFDHVSTVKLPELDIAINNGDKTTFTDIHDALPANFQPAGGTSAPTNDIDIFHYVFDNASQTRESVATLFQRLAQSAYGRVHLSRDATAGEELTYENRSTRLTASAGSFTFDEDSSELELIRDFDAVINVVDIAVPVRRVDTSVVTLCSIDDDRPAVPASGSLTLFLDYRDANNDAQSVSGTDMIAPVEETDYAMNSTEDGLGTDLSSDHTVTATFFASSAKFVISNSGSVNSFVTRLGARGRGVYAYADKHVRVEDATSVAAFGERLLSMRLPWNTDVNYADGFADWLLTQYQDQSAPGLVSVRMTYVANRHGDLATEAVTRDVGDTIDLTESVTGLDATDGDFWTIHHVSMEWVQNTELRVTYLLQHNEADNGWWVLGATAGDQLGTDTDLAYF